MPRKRKSTANRSSVKKEEAAPSAPPVSDQVTHEPGQPAPATPEGDPLEAWLKTNRPGWEEEAKALKTPVDPSTLVGKRFTRANGAIIVEEPDAPRRQFLTIGDMFKAAKTGKLPQVTWQEWENCKADYKEFVGYCQRVYGTKAHDVDTLHKICGELGRRLGIGIDAINALPLGEASKALLMPEGKGSRKSTPAATAGSTQGLLSAFAVSLQEPEWSRGDTPKNWAVVFGVSQSTIKRRFKEQAIPNIKLSSRCYQVAMKRIPSRYQNRYQQPDR